MRLTPIVNCTGGKEVLDGGVVHTAAALDVHSGSKCRAPSDRVGNQQASSEGPCTSQGLLQISGQRMKCVVFAPSKGHEFPNLRKW